jgi:hypothetical protein
MFSNTLENSKHNKMLQHIMFKESVVTAVVTVFENNSESDAIARQCMVFLYNVCKNDANKAKILRKQRGLELIKKAISIHGKNRVSGLLVLKPGKLALESVWYGAKRR